jgi:hypothetical protein
LSAHTVDPEAAQTLEGLHGRPGGGSEDAVGVNGRARQDGAQAVLNVGDGVATVTDREREAYR